MCVRGCACVRACVRACVCVCVRVLCWAAGWGLRGWVGCADAVWCGDAWVGVGADAIKWNFAFESNNQRRRELPPLGAK